MTKTKCPAPHRVLNAATASYRPPPLHLSSFDQVGSIFHVPSIQAPHFVLVLPDTPTVLPCTRTSSTRFRGQTNHSAALTGQTLTHTRARPSLRPARSSQVSPCIRGPYPESQASLWTLHPHRLRVPRTGSSRWVAGTLSVAAAMLGPAVLPVLGCMRMRTRTGSPLHPTPPHPTRVLVGSSVSPLSHASQ